MSYLPDQEYTDHIIGGQNTDDNDGNPEIHLFIGDIKSNKSKITFKLKTKTKADVQRVCDFLSKFGIKPSQLKNSAFVDALGAHLTGRQVWFRTKAWEMNGKSGVFISRINAEPFKPTHEALASKFDRFFQAEAKAAPESPGIDDDDVPF